MSEPPLIKPSALARFWQKNPRTVTGWIREGRLPATRSPGNQYRVRVADVRAICEREGLPFPPSLLPAPRSILLIGGDEAERRALKRLIKTSASLEVYADPYQGLFAAVRSPPTVLAIAQPLARVDCEAAVRALSSDASFAKVKLLVFDVPSASRAAAIERAGASATLTRARRGELPRTIAALIESA